MMMGDDASHDDMVIDVPGQPYLGEAKSWSCLATGLRFVARLRCTGIGVKISGSFQTGSWSCGYGMK